MVVVLALVLELVLVALSLVLVAPLQDRVQVYLQRPVLEVPPVMIAQPMWLEAHPCRPPNKSLPAFPPGSLSLLSRHTSQLLTFLFLL